jgi:exosortase/archaeosortase family protein
MIADQNCPTPSRLKAAGGLAGGSFALVFEAVAVVHKYRGRLLAVAMAGAISGGILMCWPAIQSAIFCHGASAFAGLLSGLPAIRVENGWLLPAALPMVVTNACSGTTYFILLTALLGWHIGNRNRFVPIAAAVAIASALPLSIGINGFRIAVLVQVHRCLIPRFPESFAPFLHLLSGVAIFLPALIIVNLVCEIYGRSSSRHGSRQPN